MNPTMRAQMGETALAAARAIDYVGAGTVEFIVDRPGGFYFMEMNTRLQVEHPVTEMVTGQDLVEWQLRVATGESLPCTQAALSIEGHAFEARVYAEDPDRDFLPATGTLSHYRPPEESVCVRVDTGVTQGDAVGIHYDPMIAKLVVWDRDRDNALRRLRSALIQFQVTGVTTNLAFLSALASHPAFAEARVDTGFIERHRAQLFGERIPADDRILAAATLSELLRIDAAAAETAARSTDPYSPWHSSSGWRLNGDNHHSLAFLDGESTHCVTAHYRDDHYQLELPGGTMRASAVTLSPDCIRIDLDGVRSTVTVVRDAAQITVISGGRNHRLILCDPLAQGMDEAVADDRVIAPMPGSIIHVPVQAGQTVQLGDPLMILEAMKMEHTLSAPFAGVVEEIHFRIGDQVEEGTELVTLVRSDS
jgi:3-methylcrotonyl-CoA carboxylase alpha subunit